MSTETILAAEGFADGEDPGPDTLFALAEWFVFVELPDFAMWDDGFVP